eukprot:TRINITY_DN41990_c0_g1_i1.p2 TRINITY_DN41990_c0_g1~~TRINITY_DN41990_c0_g1_i1.p2  ORF type:complete len:109 (-),score=17.35 TRINITY_DN41990_c0_g1_i1:7-333(-)
MSMIYLQEKGKDSSKFVKNAVMKQPNDPYGNENNRNKKIDDIFIRSIKYAVRVENEERYDIRISDLYCDCISTDFQFKPWRKLVVGDTMPYFGGLSFCIIYANKKFVF